MILDDVINAVNEVLGDKKNKYEINSDTNLWSILDSMSILEVILLVEECGYDIKRIKIETIQTVMDIVIYINSVV
jgi:acyl carrier protein